MRSSKRSAIILLAFVLSVVALIGSLLIVVSISSRPPKEAKIIRDFSAHRAEYERLRNMFLTDKDLETVADWGVITTGSPITRVPPDGGVSVKRYRGYLAPLKVIGARRLGRLEEPLDVRIGVWGSGFAGDTRHVEISWLEHKPPNTVVSLDAFYRTPKPRRPVYKHIEGNWYIWADW
jgi:hypothetical protein